MVLQVPDIIFFSLNTMFPKTRKLETVLQDSNGVELDTRKEWQWQVKLEFNYGCRLRINLWETSMGHDPDHDQ